jgi:hypothetical protein
MLATRSQRGDVIKGFLLIARERRPELAHINSGLRECALERLERLFAELAIDGGELGLQIASRHAATAPRVAGPECLDGALQRVPIKIRRGFLPPLSTGCLRMEITIRLRLLYGSDRTRANGLRH